MKCSQTCLCIVITCDGFIFVKNVIFFLTSDVKCCQKVLFLWIDKQIKSDEIYCIIDLLSPKN